MAITYTYGSVLSGYNVTQINTNFTNLETALANAVNRQGGANNSMNADFDLDGNDLLNVGNLDATTFTVGGVAASPFDWEGPWTTSTAYVFKDVVENDGSMYVCILAHTSSANDEPGVGVNEATYWELSASKGNIGATGPSGLDGVAEFQWSTGTSGDPTSGYLGVNNATMTSVTEIRISETDINSAGVGGILSILDDVINSVSKSLIKLQKAGDPTVWLVLNVTSNETDSGPYRSWTVNYVDHNGTFSANDNVWLDISLSGNDGAGAVDSVFGRSGAVVATSGDYEYGEVSNAIGSAAVITDNTIVRGDGGARGTQDSGITIDDTDNISGVTSIALDDGTVSLPSLTFSSDLNSGMYRIGTDNVGFGVNGGISFQIDASRKIVFGEGPYSSADVNAFTSVQHTGPAGTIGGNVSQGAWSNDTSSALLGFTKSRNATKGSHTAVQSGDDIGEISFHGSDGTEYIKSSFFTILADDTVSTGTVPMAITMWTGPGGLGNQDYNFRMGSSGRMSMGSSVDPASNVRLLIESNVSAEHTLLARQKQTNGAAIYGNADHATFGSVVIQAVANRAANSGYNLFQGWSGGFGDKEFQVSGDGNATCDGSFTGGGADYAEFFEWTDGNESEEDRRGYSVVLENQKIRVATHNDKVEDIIGVISGNPSVVGDAAWNKWSEKYLRDDFGTYVLEDYEVVEWSETVVKEFGKEGESTYKKVVKEEPFSYAKDAIPSDVEVPEDAVTVIQQRRILNPKYDPDHNYIPRSDRKEWDTVGLMGKLRIRKGEPVHPRWIKMREVSESVDEWLVR